MAIKAAFWTSIPSRITRNARATALTSASFSQSAIQPSEPAQPKVSASAQVSGKDEQHRDHKQQSRKDGLSFRFPLSFAVGVPLGYGLREWLRGDENDNSGSPRDFVTYTLVDRELISPTSSIFALKPATGVTIDVHDEQWDRAVISIEFKQPQLQIARHYTLLPPVPEQNPNELRFLIRKEQNGEVSGYLHRLAVGSDIELRGPSTEYILPDKVRTVLFLAGGTGIAPAMQIADILGGQADIHVLWANRHQEDCAGATSDRPPTKPGMGWSLSNIWRPASRTSDIPEKSADTGAIVKHLSTLKSTRQADGTSMRVDYFVDEQGTFIRPADVADLIRQHKVLGLDGRAGDRLLIVSGPEGFIKYWAGSKQWMNGQEVQGPLGGVLSTLNLEGWDVIKL